MTERRKKKMRKTKRSKKNNRRRTKKFLLGGIEAIRQGNVGTCYSESVSRIILKILKHPKINIVPDIKSLDPSILATLDGFEKEYIENVRQYRKTHPRDMTEYKKLENNEDLLERRKQFVNENPKLETILDTQNLYYNLFTNYFISKCGIKGAKPHIIMKWFADVLNFIINDEYSEFNQSKKLIEYLRNTRYPFCQEGVSADNSSECKYKDVDNSERSYPVFCMDDENYGLLANTFIDLANKCRRQYLNFRMALFDFRDQEGDAETRYNKMYNFIKSKIDLGFYLCVASNWEPRSIFDLHIMSNVNYLKSKAIKAETNICGELENRQNSHAFNLVGYDNTDETFTIKNSWGIEWGNFGKLSIKYLAFFNYMCVNRLSCIEFYDTQVAPIVETPSSEDPQLQIEEPTPLSSNRRKIRIQPRNAQQVNPRTRITIQPKIPQQIRPNTNTVVFDPERGFD